MKKKFQSRKCTLLTWSEWFWHWRRWKRSCPERKSSNCCKWSNWQEIFCKRLMITSVNDQKLLPGLYLPLATRFMPEILWVKEFEATLGAKCQSKGTSLQRGTTINSSFTWLRLLSNYGWKWLRFRILLNTTLITGYTALFNPQSLGVLNTYLISYFFLLISYFSL